MQQGRQQFGLHPLAQGKLAHRSPQLLAQLQHLGELANASLGLRLRNAVDRGINPQRIEGGQVPDQLLAVAHHQGDLAQEAGLTPKGLVACHLQLAAAGVDQTGEHFQSGGLAGAVGAQKANNLPRLDREADSIHRQHIAMAPPQQMLNCAGQARLLLADSVGLAQPTSANDWTCHSVLQSKTT